MGFYTSMMHQSTPTSSTFCTFLMDIEYQHSICPLVSFSMPKSSHLVHLSPLKKEQDLNALLFKYISTIIYILFFFSQNKCGSKLEIFNVTLCKSLCINLIRSICYLSISAKHGKYVERN